MTKHFKFERININALFFIFLMAVFSCIEKKSGKSSRVEVLPFYNEATFTPRWLDPNDSELDTLHKIAPYKLLNQEGK
ncbi:MAG: hypothetical protein AAGA77_12860 [Bacteroidota bacterium]